MFSQKTRKEKKKKIPEKVSSRNHKNSQRHELTHPHPKRIATFCVGEMKIERWIDG
jgi:hypothetical protein